MMHRLGDSTDVCSNKRTLHEQCLDCSSETFGMRTLHRDVKGHEDLLEITAVTGKEDFFDQSVGAAAVNQRLSELFAERVESAADEDKPGVRDVPSDDARRFHKCLLTFDGSATRRRRRLSSAHRWVKMRDESDERSVRRNPQLAPESIPVDRSGMHPINGGPVVDACDALVGRTDLPIQRCGVFAPGDDRGVRSPCEAIGGARHTTLEMPRPDDASDVSRACEQTGEARDEVRHEYVRVSDVDALLSQQSGDPDDRERQDDQVEQKPAAIEISAEVQGNFVVANPACFQTRGKVPLGRIDDRYDLEPATRHLEADVREPRRVARCGRDLCDPKRLRRTRRWMRRGLRPPHGRRLLR
ncbi:MAG TPA: hypothetical protein VL284_14260 [Thermoanaerobaculia bacterium]|nr:hypothetical protein [Thermoanaerobaculia bacterium]